MFRYKRAIQVSYVDQGYIYFLCRRYDRLPESKRGMIRYAAEVATGEPRMAATAEAVMEFVTTDHGITKVCTAHCMSESALHRAVSHFYIIMGQYIRSGRL